MLIDENNEIDYRIYLWLLTQVNEYDELDIISFVKSDIKKATGIKHSSTLDEYLDNVLYVPVYNLFESMPGSFRVVKPINFYQQRLEGKKIFSILMDKNIAKKLLKAGVGKGDQLIRLFLLMWRGATQHTPYKPSLTTLVEGIGMVSTSTNRKNVQSCLDWLEQEGFISIANDTFETEKGYKNPCLNIKWLWSNDKPLIKKSTPIVETVIEEVVEEIEDTPVKEVGQPIDFNALRVGNHIQLSNEELEMKLKESQVEKVEDDDDDFVF